MTQYLQNNPENNILEDLIAGGKMATKRGWPDFVAYSDDFSEIMVIEVKPRSHNRLPSAQAQLMLTLNNYGIDCYVARGGNVEPFDPELHVNHEALAKWKQRMRRNRTDKRPRRQQRTSQNPHAIHA